MSPFTDKELQQIREQFPLLSKKQGEKNLVYLDSAATTQKPLAVIDAMSSYYREHNSTFKRAIYRLSNWTTERCEEVRHLVARFVNAPSAEEIIFTRGTTEAINLVAQSWGRSNLNPGDAILLGALEHHANIVPWQMVAEEREAEIRVLPSDDDGNLLVEQLPSLLEDEKVKIVAINYVANSIGTVNPIAEIAAIAKEYDALLLVDGAQSTSHFEIDLQKLGCDFYAFSGHKIYGPTGIGILWGRAELLEKMPPWYGGGEMIDKVTFQKTTYAEPPARFEAGTPPIAEIIGLGAAIEWMESIGLQRIAAHEDSLLIELRKELLALEKIRLIGNAKRQSAIQSFVIQGVHPHDAALILDEEALALRAGHHCAQPVMERFGVSATLRASLAVYNHRDEMKRLTSALRRVQEIFA